MAKQTATETKYVAYNPVTGEYANSEYSHQNTKNLNKVKLVTEVTARRYARSMEQGRCSYNFSRRDTFDAPATAEWTVMELEVTRTLKADVSGTTTPLMEVVTWLKSFAAKRAAESKVKADKTAANRAKKAAREKVLASLTEEERAAFS